MRHSVCTLIIHYTVFTAYGGIRGFFNEKVERSGKGRSTLITSYNRKTVSQLRTCTYTIMLILPVRCRKVHLKYKTSLILIQKFDWIHELSDYTCIKLLFRLIKLSEQLISNFFGDLFSVAVLVKKITRVLRMSFINNYIFSMLIWILSSFLLIVHP